MEDYKITKIGPFELIDYSAAAIALKISKDDLHRFKLLGPFKDNAGRWNQYLKCGPAWIFPLKRKEDVVNLLLACVPAGTEFKTFEKPQPKPKFREYFND